MSFVLLSDCVDEALPELLAGLDEGTGAEPAAAATGTPEDWLSVLLLSSLAEAEAELLAALDEFAPWLADEDGEGAALLELLLLRAKAEGLALGGAAEMAGLGVGAGVGVVAGLGALAAAAIVVPDGVVTLGVDEGAGDGAAVWAEDSLVGSGCSAALELNSRDKNAPLPSAVEDAVLVPDISAVMVPVFRVVLVSESTLMSAFQNTSRHF